jgi:hypothetical protein
MSGRSSFFGVLASAALCLATSGCALSEFAADAAPPGTPDAAPPGTPDASASGPATLPFAVDDWYGPSGYMGDGSHPGGIMDQTVCIEPRPATWVGHCHQFTWTPGTEMWAGVYWQYPDKNWGDKPGLEVPAGATGISFSAWGKVGGEQVTFVVGMMAVDGFELKKELVTLATTPTEYTIELGSTSYGRVVGGFAWTAEGSTTPITFNVDDIRWK